MVSMLGGDDMGQYSFKVGKQVNPITGKVERFDIFKAAAYDRAYNPEDYQDYGSVTQGYDLTVSAVNADKPGVYVNKGNTIAGVPVLVKVPVTQYKEVGQLVQAPGLKDGYVDTGNFRTIDGSRIIAVNSVNPSNSSIGGTPVSSPGMSGVNMSAGGDSVAVASDFLGLPGVGSMVSEFPAEFKTVFKVVGAMFGIAFLLKIFKRGK